MANRNYVLTREMSRHALKRLALELAEELSGNDAPVVIIGIRTNGEVIAGKIAEALHDYVPNDIKVISASLDKMHPTEVQLSESLVLDNLNLVLADDVSNSGRTLLYALKPLLQFHPRTIRTLVLVERMHKQFPVKPDHVGLSIATTLQDHIIVEVENGEIAGAYIA